MSRASKPTQHLPYLDGLRGLAAVYVVIHHAALQFKVQHASLLARIVLSFFAHGRYAVDVFIVLSGFCLMIPAVRGNYRLAHGTRHFYLKRARRILPPYFASIAFSLMLIVLLVGNKTGSLWDQCVPVTLKGLITHLLLVHDLFRDTTNQINYVFWSVAVECRIYLLFPLMLLCWRTLGRVAAMMIAFLAAALLLLATLGVQRRFPGLQLSMGSCPHFLALFSMGMFAADMAFGQVDDSRLTDLPWGTLLAGSTLLMIVLPDTAFLGRALPWQLVDVLVGAWAVCLLMFAVGHSGPHHADSRTIRWLSKRGFVFVGTIAYSIYLIHAPLLQVLLQYGIIPLHRGPLLSEVMLMLVGLSLVIATAWLFFAAFEEPFVSVRQSTPAASLQQGGVLQPAIWTSTDTVSSRAA